jgi:DnaJ-class molecular chaperone
MNIKICKNCDGKGEIRTDVGYHQSDYEYNTCSSCRGTGRVYVSEYSISVPFGSDLKEFYAIDKFIIDSIIKLKR